MAGGAVRLVELRKGFGEVSAVDGIDLDVASGEFFSLLGPSGCGKTTTLRLIAGFERPDSGAILLDGVDMAHTPPHKRRVNTVFQSYALFPHMTVADNVAFGLAYRNVSKQQATTMVGEALERVRLGGYERRRPHQLSGGQQQRVALARALVLDPEVLLLDEPLGALDAKLRKALQIELKALQEGVGKTFIYVTHDQEEALTMSDRLAVMSSGRIEQIGAPDEVYEEPTTAYVADFLGVSNLMEAELVGDSPEGHRVRTGEFDMVASGGAGIRGEVKITIRPERIVLEPHGTTGENRIPALVERVVYVGSVIQCIARLPGGQTIQASVPNQGQGVGFDHGEAIAVHFPREALRVLPATSDSGPAEGPSSEGDGDPVPEQAGSPSPAGAPHPAE
ncbi:MAG TPA: ABC transporter ATP-binding protein [Actinomycetota bacterium]